MLDKTSGKRYTNKADPRGSRNRKKKFEKKIEIPKGQNTLKIVAVDINNNQSEKSQDFCGLDPPGFYGSHKHQTCPRLSRWVSVFQVQGTLD